MVSGQATESDPINEFRWESEKREPVQDLLIEMVT